MSQTSPNRRRYVRLAADDNIVCDIGGQKVVHVVGLGSQGHGMRIITDSELPDGSEIPVSLVLDGDAVGPARARVVWQESWDFGFCNRHVAGIEFLDIDPALQDRLKALIPDEDDRQPVPDEHF